VRLVREQRAEPRAQELARGRERRPAGGRQLERLDAPVAQARHAADEPGRLERGEELRDGRARHVEPPRELGAREVSGGGGVERQILRRRQRRLEGGEQPLDPAATKERDPDERVCVRQRHS
jgi:hypothetical protein